MTLASLNVAQVSRVLGARCKGSAGQVQCTTEHKALTRLGTTVPTGAMEQTVRVQANNPSMPVDASLCACGRLKSVVLSLVSRLRARVSAVRLASLARRCLSRLGAHDYGKQYGTVPCNVVNSNALQARRGLTNLCAVCS